jgi:hypothetical protein
MGRETADKLTELLGLRQRQMPTVLAAQDAYDVQSTDYLALQGGTAAPLPRRAQKQTAGDLDPVAGDPAGAGKAMINPPTTDSA